MVRREHRVTLNHASVPDRRARLALPQVLAIQHQDLRGLPLSLRKTNLARLLARRPDGIFVAPFEQGEIGPDLFRAACDMGLEGMVSKRADRPAASRRTKRRGGSKPPVIRRETIGA